MGMALALVACGGDGGGGDRASAPAAGDGGGATVVGAATSAAAPVALIEPLVRTALQTQDVSPFRPRRSERGLMASQVVLPPLDEEEERRRTLMPTAISLGAESGAPTRIGIGRAIPATSSRTGVTALLDWVPSSNGGRIAALTFRSTNASGVRLGLLVRDLPMAAVVRFHVPGSATAFEVAAREILDLIQRNLDAGDTTDAARTYWSPDLGGDEVTMEIEVPAGVDPATTDLSVPSLSHIHRRLGEPQEVRDPSRDLGDSGACQRNVTCDPAYERESRSVALMSFVDDGDSYTCTGTLMNDRASSGTPYFLTARHCIGQQTVASTLITLWFARASACANAIPLPSLTLVAGGATLLYAGADTDTSFMRLNATPPTGAIHAGSSPFAAELFKEVFTLHHPSGDLQKLNLGYLWGFASCTPSGASDTFSCANASPTIANYLLATWQQGATEAGSSGSGLFTRLNGTSYLIGQLRGGASSCVNRIGLDGYGRFDRAYQAALSQWLNRASDTIRTPVFRFYNIGTATHFYTTDAVERDRTIDKYGATFIYEGPVFHAYGARATGSSPVHRFYNPRTNSHFYTISDSERANVVARYPWFAFEGTGWFANVGAGAGSMPVFRFYNTWTGTHFYTISAAERDTVRQRYPQFLYEGAVYEAWTAP